MSSLSHEILTGIQDKKSINIHIANSFLISSALFRTNPLHYKINFRFIAVEITANISALFHVKSKQCGLIKLEIIRNDFSSMLV